MIPRKYTIVTELMNLLLYRLMSLALAAAQQVPTFTAEQEARLQIREVMDGLYVIPGFDGGQSGGKWPSG